MRFHANVLGIAAILGWCAVGCTSKDDGDGTADGGGTVEMFSWWTSGGERDALSALVAVHEERVPGAKVVNAAVEFADKAREELQTRLEQGVPPDTFQANIGADLFKWVLFNGKDDAATKVESLQSMAEAEGWLTAFDSTVLEAGSFDDKLYGLPLNVHRINSLFLRKDLFEKFGLEPPTSVEELLSLCDAIATDADIQAEGKVSCMALGDKWNWTFSLMTFEMLLPAMAGAEYYESFWLGEESAADTQLSETLDLALQLYCGGTDTSDCLKTSYFNSDIHEVDWDEALGKLVDGSALMAPMGDWAKGYLESVGLEPGVEFEVIPFPGSDGTFVFTSDTFPLPIGAPNRKGAIELFRTFASKEGQIAFNRIKGSITPRTDIEPSEFDEVTQETMAAFSSSTKVKALSGLLPSELMPDLASELRDSLQAGSMEIVMNYIKANYDSIRR